MKKTILIALSIFSLSTLFAQDGCFDRLQKAFEKRGSYAVADDMHRNVILSFFTPDGQECLSGKVRVENGYITSIFIQYRDGDFFLLEKKFYNQQKNPPKVTNGISEMIVNADRENFRVVFIDRLKPKKKSLQRMEVPDDL